VLAIDDEPIMLRLISHALKGYEVVALDDAAKALARLAAGERFDAIFCDLHMKNMGGEAFLKELSLLRPADARRMLFLTGGATSPADELFLKSVAGRVLVKPVEVKRLRAAVEAVVAAGR
jgi:CheY-like chemotaxis protein